MPAMKEHIIAAVVILAAAVQVPGRLLRTRALPKVYDIQPCRHKSHFLHMDSFKVTIKDDGTEYCDLNGTLSKDVNTISKITIALYRCTGTVAENTCEYFNTFKWTAGICQLILLKGTFWTPVVDSFHPKCKCPFKKGRYNIINATLDYDKFGDLLGSEMEKYIWKGDLEAFNELEERAVCAIFIGEIRRVPVKH